MNAIKREGGERLYYILKHYRKLAKKIKRLYPEGDSLCRAYQSLDKAFDEVIIEESKYQANFFAVERASSFIIQNDKKTQKGKSNEPKRNDSGKNKNAGRQHQDR